MGSAARQGGCGDAGRWPACRGRGIACAVIAAAMHRVRDRCIAVGEIGSPCRRAHM